MLENTFRRPMREVSCTDTAKSFKKIWVEVGEATGTKWTVDCDFELFDWLSKEERDKVGPGMGMIRFSVVRE